MSPVLIAANKQHKFSKVFWKTIKRWQNKNKAIQYDQHFYFCLHFSCICWCCCFCCWYFCILCLFILLFCRSCRLCVSIRAVRSNRWFLCCCCAWWTCLVSHSMHQWLILRNALKNRKQNTLLIHSWITTCTENLIVFEVIE